MNINEITNLIKIKDYLSSSINNFNLDKATVTELSKLIPVIDRKIINLLRSDDFMSYVKIDTNIEPVVQSIKSGLKK